MNHAHRPSQNKAELDTGVVLQYLAAYDNKALATETITARQEADGSWKVAGYFIK